MTEKEKVEIENMLNLHTIQIEFGGRTYQINRALVKKQNVDPDNFKEMALCYFTMENLFDEAGRQNPKTENGIRVLKLISQAIRDLEFKMQGYWNFPQDKNFHSYWYKIPHCACPILDNQDRIGTGMNVYSCDCPIHGEEK